MYIKWCLLPFLDLHSIIEPQNHRTAWVGSDLRDHLVSILLPWARIPFSRPDCSKSACLEHFWGWDIHNLTIIKNLTVLQTVLNIFICFFVLGNLKFNQICPAGHQTRTLEGSSKGQIICALWYVFLILNTNTFFLENSRIVLFFSFSSNWGSPMVLKNLNSTDI